MAEYEPTTILGLTDVAAPDPGATGNGTWKYNAGNGTSWVDGLTPPVDDEPVKLLMDFDTGIVDRSTYGRTVTAEGDATRTDDKIVFSGAGCLDISGDMDLGVGAVPFQVEGWANITDITGSGLFGISHGGLTPAWNGTDGLQYLMGFIQGGVMYAQWESGAGLASLSVDLFDVDGNTTTALANGTETYFAFSYDGTNLSGYLGETRVFHGAATFGGTSLATLLKVGDSTAANIPLTGTLDNFRVQMGAGFTPHSGPTITIPTPPFPIP